MGVPGLWPFVQKGFGRRAIRRFLRGKGRYQFDYVYLDANGLLHGAAQQVFNYGGVNRKIDPYANLTVEQKMTKVFELFFDDILEVTSMAVPTKLLYIAIDGPAPRAKQNQQRERRFVAARDRTKKVGAFDSNCITPGTEFMHKLSQFMYWKIRSYMQTRGPWKTIQVVYSPPTIPGEGEHKIMDFIRTLPAAEQASASHCMFGPDGDLLMLTLSAHVSKMSLFRADQFNEGWYDLINMSMIGGELAQALGQRDAVRTRKRTNHDVSNDFVLIGFFVGNDFLPKIKMFYKLSHGLQKMFDTYSQTSNMGFEHHLTDGNRILVGGFQQFAYRLSRFEEEYLLDQATVTAPDPRFVDETLLAHTSTVNEGRNLKQKIDMAGYRKAYYAKAGIPEGKGVTAMCRSYLKNLIWVYLYYVDALPSWEQAYLHHHAPLMADFSAYLNTLTQKDMDEIARFDRSSAAYPFEQLLSVLPPASNELLPEHYRSLLTDESSPLVKAGYYPETFDIDFEGVLKEFKGVVILPFVDYTVVSKAYRTRKKTAQLKWHRNERGNAHTFRWVEKSVNYKSVYGEIRSCRVEVTSH